MSVPPESWLQRPHATPSFPSLRTVGKDNSIILVRDDASFLI